MPITPDLPFPKSAGDSIRSKDWNDLVNETKRLDIAKVDRAGDAITGPLSVAGALAIGKASAAATAKLDVVGDLRINDSNLYLRGGSDTNHGLGWFGGSKLFATANVDGPVLWGASGGVLGTSNGAGQVAALSWDSAGRVAIGVLAAGFKVDIGDRIRLRQGPSGDAGLWLYQNGPAEDRAFVGLASDDDVGFWGDKGVGWGLRMDVTLGTFGVRRTPSPNAGMWINAGSAGTAPALPIGLIVTGATTWGLYVSGNAYITGRTRDAKVRSEVVASNAVSTSTLNAWLDIPNLSMTIISPDIGAYFDIRVNINGVQGTNAANIRGWFRLLVDGGEQERTANEFHNAGWELRGVMLSRIIYLAAGSHTVSVQWYLQGAGSTLTCCWYGDQRKITVIEL